MTTLPALWASHLAAWHAWLVAGALPSTTCYLRRYQLRRLARAFPDRSPWDLTPDDLAGWLASHQWARETTRSYRAALRSFYGWAHATGKLTNDPARLLRKVAPAQARPRPAPEAIVSEALGSADHRVWMMLALAAQHGLRRGEIARVHTRDVIDDGDDGWSLRVHGKGDKERIIPLFDDIALAIRQAPHGFLFPGNHHGHLSAPWVGRLMARALAEGVTAHQLRHRFASRTYQATKDIRSVQELLGHASVATTQRYAAPANGALRATLRTAA